MGGICAMAACLLSVTALQMLCTGEADVAFVLRQNHLQQRVFLSSDEVVNTHVAMVHPPSFYLTLQQWGRRGQCSARQRWLTDIYL